MECLGGTRGRLDERCPPPRLYRGRQKAATTTAIRARFAVPLRRKPREHDISCPYESRSVGFDEVAAAIFLPALFVGFGAEGLFFAEADGVEAVGGDALGD